MRRVRRRPALREILWTTRLSGGTDQQLHPCPRTEQNCPAPTRTHYHACQVVPSDLAPSIPPCAGRPNCCPCTSPLPPSVPNRKKVPCCRLGTRTPTRPP